jgi:hypothetical protein
MHVGTPANGKSRLPEVPGTFTMTGQAEFSFDAAII